MHVTYDHTNDVVTAEKWLKELELFPFFGADFEVAIRYTKDELDFVKRLAEDDKQDYIERKRAEALLSATPLDHPAHSLPTHLSIATSETDSKVIIIDSNEMLELVMDFLVTTETKQVWHNASYDFKHIYYHTGKMPKDYEDTQIFTKTLLNHVDVAKATSGLKELAGHAYGDWAIAQEQFTLEQMYNPFMIKYAAIDSCATVWVYNRLMESTAADMDYIRSTAEDYSPMDQLPTVSPKNAIYPDAYFYHNTAKFLVRDTVRIMMNGLPISLEKVRELENTLVDILDAVEKKLSSNYLVSEYLKLKNESLISSYKDIQLSKLRDYKDYIEEFDPSKKVHRSYFMYYFAERVGIIPPDKLLPTGIPEWTANAVKKLVPAYPPLKKLVDKSIAKNNPTALAAMELLARHKTSLYNEKYLKRVEEPKVDLITFNPNSSVMKQEIFAWLGLESDTVSAKTGNSSWNREEVERVNTTTEDEDIRDFTQALIDHSFASIVKNNFINSFYKYTVGNELHGQYRLLGAKSGRFTSSNPNMLNAPSTGSVFAKPVKACFIAPKGYIVAAIDYAALEDRVIANLSEDENKLNIFLLGVDGHSLAACFYWPQEVEAQIGYIEDASERALKFKEEMDKGNTALKELRNRGKRISFGLAYGAYPPKVAKSAKISIEEATTIFNAYHNELYPMITKYREEYVLKTTESLGYIHLGMGFRLYTDNPAKDIRTSNNATCQFWSILTLLTINKLHQLIDAQGYSNKIVITATIYDSIYFVVKDDPKIIKWLNDNIIPIMEKDFMFNQILPNSVDLEIGPSWEKLYTLPHNADTQEIIQVRKQWH